MTGLGFGLEPCARGIQRKEGEGKMRILLSAALTVAVALGSAIRADQPTKFPSNAGSPVAPWTVAEAFQIGRFNGTLWSLSIEFNKPEYPILSRAQIAKAFTDFVAVDHPENVREDDQGNQLLLREHAALFAQVYSDIPNISGEARIVILGDGGNRALLVARRGEVRCLIVPSVSVTTVYNTLRTEDRERATKIASSIALPALRSLAAIEGLGEAGVTCVGVGVSYASKNFAGRQGLDAMPKTEYVGVAASISDIKLFASGELAEEELLGRSDVFLQDRTMVAEIKKIMLGVRP